MLTKNVEHEFIVPDSIEVRDYQINLAQQAKTENSLIVLPTGLGKTTIALHVIAHFLSKRKGGILFLAPTRVLANQHYEFLKKTVRLDDITLITGEDLLAKRKKLWINSIICATPEIVRNDIIRKIVDVSQFSLVIFDEAHRAVGDYAYTTIAEQLNIDNTRILGMTATLPSEKEKAKEVCDNLHIKGIAERSDSSPDVKPYIQNTITEWVKVDLPPEMKIIQRYIKLAQDQRYTELRRNGLRLSDNKSLSQLLNARQFVLKQNRRSAKPLFTAIRITYALNIFEAHGITSFLKFCERTKIKKGAGIKELFETDPNFTTAINLAKDVDGVTVLGFGNMAMGEKAFGSCTPQGIIRLLCHYDIEVAGKHVVIIGRSNIVGKPVANLLMQRTKGANATVTVCHTRTTDLREITRTADILIAAVGQPNYVTADMVSEGVVVIDVGINRVEAPERKRGYKLVGDVDFEEVSKKSMAITPVPGGVGPMTIAMLLTNTVKAARLTLETSQ